jgi:hypothetical protein
MRVHSPWKSGHRRAFVVAFVASFGSLWLAVSPASAGLTTRQIPASAQPVAVTARSTPAQDGAATSADQDAGITARGDQDPDRARAAARPRAAVLVGFFTVNAVVVLTAGVLRYRSTARRGHRRAQPQARSPRSRREAELA